MIAHPERYAPMWTSDEPLEHLVERGSLALLDTMADRTGNITKPTFAALTEFGYVPAVRDGMRRVWYSRWYDARSAVTTRSR